MENTYDEMKHLADAQEAKARADKALLGNRPDGYSMVVAVSATGKKINAWCKDFETLDAAFSRLATTHGIESWEGWVLSAWPREQRVIVRETTTGHFLETGIAKNPCRDCDGSPTIARRERCEWCHKQEVANASGTV